MRVYKFLKDLNISFTALENVLNALGDKEYNLTSNSVIPDNIVFLLQSLCSHHIEFAELVDIVTKKIGYKNQLDLKYSLKVIGKINLESNDNSTFKQGFNKSSDESLTMPTPINIKTSNFWISELAILSSNDNVNSITIGSFEHSERFPLYSVLIGANGTGKSSLMKELVDFFIDLHFCVDHPTIRLSSTNNRLLKGVKYFVDGVKYEVIRLDKNYVVRINGHLYSLKDIPIPSLVACHFGAFDKFPKQKVNGSAQTKYDVSHYKYVGAHVNGNMISSSAIAFRLLFALNEQMDNLQRKNICSILDEIGYDHKISLSYSLVMKSKKNGEARSVINQHVDKDKEYNKFSREEKRLKTDQLYNFYRTKITSGKSIHNYEIDFDNNCISSDYINELQYIYKLKQYDLINSTNVIFHKQECDITSDEMSSGEFAMLSTILSISAAANEKHTLVLLDEPELSLHPNWQMSLIDNLDRALTNKVCHLIISTHSHMLVSDLPMNRSSVNQIEKDDEGNIISTTIPECTYGWSAEEVLLKVFKTATDRNRYFGERIGVLLERMSTNSIRPNEVVEELKELQEISKHLSDIDPMKMILNTIVETYK